jgi:competence protein ComEC
MAPAFALAPAGPQAGEAWITTLDVGQGLAVLVRTANRVLLYDAGPAFGAEADSGGRIVLPGLRAAGLASVDALVLSHEDLDHIGGALTVLESIEVGSLYSSLRPGHPLNALARAPGGCAAGTAWDWDGVRFEFLHPPPGAPRARRNDASCVLRIASRGGAMLLTGDIERAAEATLLASAAPLKSEVLLVPHHGSRSSSSEAFVAAVAPRWAVVPAGYRNRFGHPHAQVLARYRAAGAEVVRTDAQGAIHVALTRHAVTVRAERERSPRYWRRLPRV